MPTLAFVQFGLLTVSLVIIALADTLSDFGIANSIIQRKEISHLELTTLIQEQNSYAGVTNKLLAQKAEKICVAYEGK